MQSSSNQIIIQKIILLATGVPGSVVVRDEITRLFQETEGLDKVAALVDNFMNDLSTQNENGITGVATAIYKNGFGLELSIQEVEQIIADFLRQGINSWSELFAEIILNTGGENGKILDNRAIAADIFTNAIEPEFNINDSSVREWIEKIDASDESLEIAKESIDVVIDPTPDPPLVTPPTIVENSVFAYDENQLAGITIGVVTVVDNVEITEFSIVSGNENGFFVIDVFGNISLTTVGAESAVNDFETTPNSIILGVTASDSAGNTSSVQAITLNVNNIDEGVPIITNPGAIFDYDENQAAGDTIGSVTAIGTIVVTEFAIVSGNENNFFAIDTLGNISLTATGTESATNDFETTPNNTTLGVTASDSAGNTSSVQAITLNVNNVDEDAPIITNPGAIFDYDENQVAGAIIGSVTAIDAIGVTEFAIVSGNENNFFAIDTLGNISLTATGTESAINDFEITPNNTILGVIAADATGNISAAQEVTFNVIDVDESVPVITDLATSINYDENQTVGTTIGVINATDDIGITNFTIVSGNENNFFAIDTLGNLSLTAIGVESAVNDFEITPNSTTLAITALDAAGNTSAIKNITLDINDVNEGPIVIDPGISFNYDENQFEGATIAVVTVPGNAGVLAGFDIVSGNDRGFFVIGAFGNISLTATGVESEVNDFETLPNSTVLGVTTLDVSGNISAVQNITLNVNNITEGAPIFPDLNSNLSGDAGDNILIGDDGNNFIGAGAGNDIITAGGGLDTILAGPGKDSVDLTEAISVRDFVQSREGDGSVAIGGIFTTPDTVISFNADIDKVQLSSAETSIVLNSTPVIPTETLDFSNIAQNEFDANGSIGGAFITDATAVSLVKELDVITAIGTIANETVGEEAYFAVANTNGLEFGVYHFVSSTADNAITAGELEILGQITFTGVLDNTDLATTTV